MTLKLSFTENPDPNDVQLLTNGIMAYARQKKDFDSLDFFACFIRDEENVIVGGCSGGTLYGCIHIDNLWVDERIRNKGWGTKLVRAALSYGQEKGCAMATVNTMDWEALGFYQKLGFTLEFERHGFHKNSIFYFLRKELKVPLEIEKESPCVIRSFLETDISQLVSEFAKHHWPKPRETFELYWAEQVKSERLVWMAFFNEQLAGYVTLKRTSYYRPFKENHIPEIMDLNVLPPFRNKGIGSLLIETAEKEAFKSSDTIGLGVGLYKDYGPAQKIYIARGYQPDGRGVTYNYQPIEPGKMVCLDDDLVLWFTKSCKKHDFLV
ncbi:GNAT family acetyltransferase [Legionella adelaidensis]|uniref:GNAT family acetyltransferase n=1 Tax=Legionella adelaidensis TaxID=45056 RepID=A0A0W0R0W2_9GAMM|nr:GNAT family N-acetyltransferase [Legionella adelaidensis]KTC64735.1 GNAT family acetyltransferase [Legionella adelaidensis]